MIQSYIILDPKSIISAKPGPNRMVVESIEGKDISIKQIRELISWAGMTGFEAGEKQAIILTAQHLSRDSAHTLLKTLEEPTAQTQIILTVDTEDSLLPTIRSRCAILSLAQVSNQQLNDWGVSIAESGNPLPPQLTWRELEQAQRVDRWKLVEPYLKAKDSANLIRMLDNWQHDLQQQLSQSHGPELTITAKRLQALSRSRAALEAHVLPKLAIDLFLLSLDQKQIL